MSWFLHLYITADSGIYLIGSLRGFSERIQEKHLGENEAYYQCSVHDAVVTVIDGAAAACPVPREVRGRTRMQ